MPSRRFIDAALRHRAMQHLLPPSYFAMLTPLRYINATLLYFNNIYATAYHHRTFIL